MNTREIFEADFNEHIETVRESARVLSDTLVLAEKQLRDALQGGGKVLACGNGGSAADSQHFIAELVGRFEKERGPLAGVALTTDTSNLTAIANDYGYDQVFERQVRALARPGDVLVAISTSGNSPSILKAAEAAKAAGAKVIGMTGIGGGKLAAMADLLIAVPVKRTARVQEVHEICLHSLCHALDLSMTQPTVERSAA